MRQTPTRDVIFWDRKTFSLHLFLSCLSIVILHSILNVRSCAIKKIFNYLMSCFSFLVIFRTIWISFHCARRAVDEIEMMSQLMMSLDFKTTLNDSLSYRLLVYFIDNRLLLHRLTFGIDSKNLLSRYHFPSSSSR